jgi:phenylacetate-CoA ligase
MDFLAKLELGMRVIGMRRRDRWSRQRLAARQAAHLARLVRFARQRSPYYSRTLRGERLHDLPILTKHELTSHWDEIVTDRSLRLADLRRFLAGSPAADALHDGRYHVMSTSGTTGVSAVFCYSEREWVQVIASAARLTAWRGLGPSRSRRTALVLMPGGSMPPPMGARMAVSFARLFPKTTFIDASLPMPAIVRALAACRPDVVSTYAGTLSAIAEEQLAGRLQIAPTLLQSSSEVLSPAARERITAAFDLAPHNTYAMTEAGIVAGTCAQQRNLHVQDDQVILEVLDAAGRPAAPGTFGSRVLLTVLWSRTLPLIRYEITDRVCISAEPCPCGRAYTSIAEIDGRAGDVLELAGERGGHVHVTPSQLQRILAPWPLATWQVRRDGARVGLCVVPREPEFDLAGCRAAVHRALTEAGAVDPPIEVRVVEAIAPLPSGKLPRFVLS